MRKRFFDDIKRIERGEDPSGLIRDPAKNVRVEVPIVSREMLTEGLTLAEMLDDPSVDPRLGFPNQFGLPEAVRVAFLEAMGLDPNGDIKDGRAFYSPENPTIRNAWSGSRPSFQPAATG